MRKLFVLIAIALLAACAGVKDGAEFVGEWHHSKYAEDRLIISQGEEGFLVTRIEPKAFGGGVNERKLPARYENRSLIAMPLAPIVYDKESDTLSLGISTYKRAR